MEKERIIKLDVFKCDIHIVVTEDANKSIDERGLRAWVGDSPDADLMKRCDGIVFQKNKSDYYVLLSPNIGVDAMAHEAVHVVGRVFRDRMQEADYDNDEIFAYYVGWITGIIADEVGAAYALFVSEDNGAVEADPDCPDSCGIYPQRQVDEPVRVEYL
jgi:hypothetical protein